MTSLKVFLCAVVLLGAAGLHVSLADDLVTGQINDVPAEQGEKELADVEAFDDEVTEEGPAVEELYVGDSPKKWLGSWLSKINMRNVKLASFGHRRRRRHGRRRVGHGRRRVGTWRKGKSKSRATRPRVRNSLRYAKRKLRYAKRKFNSARRYARYAQRKLRTARYAMAVARRKLSLARHRMSFAQRRLAYAQRRVRNAQRIWIALRHRWIAARRRIPRIRVNPVPRIRVNPGWLNMLLNRLGKSKPRVTFARRRTTTRRRFRLWGTRKGNIYENARVIRLYDESRSDGQVMPDDELDEEVLSEE